MQSLSRRRFLLGTASLGLGALAGCRSVPRALASPVKYEFFRNATARLTYGDLTLLLDPMLSPKGALPSFAGIAPNPTVDLPASPEEIVEDVDAVLVSHLHADHFDAAAAELLQKDLAVITPRNSALVNPADPETMMSFKAQLEGYGFINVTEIDSDAGDSIQFEGITLHQVWARHGHGPVGDFLGGVNGIVFSAEGQPTIYWVGDTILDEGGEIESILKRFKPDIVIAHTGGPVIEAVSPELLLMDAREGAELIRMADRYNPNVNVIAVHMESLDHCFSTRADLQERVGALPDSLRERVHIPADGEKITLR